MAKFVLCKRVDQKCAYFHVLCDREEITASPHSYMSLVEMKCLVVYIILRIKANYITTKLL